MTDSLPPPRQPPHWLTALLLAATLLGSVWFVGFVRHSGEALERRRVQELATTAAASLLPEEVAALSGTPADIEAAAFAHVRAHLQRVHEVNPDFRFVYLMHEARDGQLRFMADAEPVASPDYSAPGDIYDGAPDVIRQVLQDGVPTVQSPSRDRWGYWVTGLAPVHGRDGAIIAVLGMDMSADDWLSGVARYRNFALTISALALALVSIFLAGTRMQHRSRLYIEAINTRLAHELTERARAQERLRLADVVVRHTEEGVMVLGADTRIQSVNPAFERITGFAADDALGRDPRLLADPDGLPQGLIEALRADLGVQGRWEGTVPARRRDGQPFPLETTVNLVRNAEGDVEHYAVVFRDVTLKKQWEDRLRALSSTDGLTEVANRRRFDETLEHEWQRALRDGTSLSLVLADIDHFKRFNDRYGHVAGDECLKAVAAAMRTSVHRAGDCVARYGGEEFAVILPSTDAAQATAIAERIRAAVAAIGIAHAGNTAAAVVTVSLGVACITPQMPDEAIGLLQSADQALYLAKHRGRNRVVTA